jgi:hypothetical protein
MSRKNKRNLNDFFNNDTKTKKGLHRRLKERDEKRNILDLLMELKLCPKPLKGGWISFDCPVCCQGKAALNCNVTGFYCGHCDEIRTIPYLVVAAKNTCLEGNKVENKKDDNNNDRSIKLT